MVLAACAACSLSVLAENVLAQGAPQPGGDGARQPNRGGDGQRRGGFGGGGMFGGGMGRMTEPAVSSEDLERYGKMVNLDKAQQQTVKDLYDAYKADTDAMMKSARDKIDAIREEARDDPSRWQELGEEMQKIRTKRTEMEKSFFNDVKLTLTPEQQEKWTGVERLRRRETSIGRGLMSGERVDLVRIVEDLKLKPEQAQPLQATLDQYATDLDRELTARNEVYDRAQGNIRQMMTGGDPEAMQKMMDEGRAASKKVRDVNNRYARQIEGMLPEDAKAKYQEAVKRASFPMIYRPTYANRVIDAAADMADLTAEQKQSITEIKERYAREIGTINAKLETESVKREESVTAADMMGGFGRGGGRGGMESEEMQTLRNQRRELDTTTIDRIEALLTPEQKAKLPERNADGEGRRPRGGENDAGGNNNGDQPRRRPRNGQGGGQNNGAPTGRT